MCSTTVPPPRDPRRDDDDDPGRSAPSPALTPTIEPGSDPTPRLIPAPAPASVAWSRGSNRRRASRVKGLGFRV
jgi:hypothetical protein